MGVMTRYCIDNDKIQQEYVAQLHQRALLVKDDFGCQDGLFTGYDGRSATMTGRGGTTRSATDGFAQIDPTLQHPRCV